MIINTNWDVVVCGAGPAGMSAAIAAARNGARTLLIERHGYLGGASTVSSVGPFMPFFVRGPNPEGPPLRCIDGIGEELVRRLMDAEGSPGHFPEYTPFDPEILKYVYLRMAEEAKVSLILHSFIVDAIVEGDTIKGVTIETKSGRMTIMGKVIVDTSGDADVAARSGVGYEIGWPGSGLTQPPTLFIRVSHVESEKLAAYAGEHGDFFSHLPFPLGTPIDHWRFRPIEPIPEGKGYSSRWFMARIMADEIRKAKESGALYYGRDSVNIYTDVFEGDFILNATRVLGGASMLDIGNLTHAEIDARKQAMSLMSLLRKYCPGFRHARIRSTGPQLGVRETRRVRGEYQLTADDVKDERKFPDAIAIYGYPMDVHSPNSGESQASGLPWNERFPKNGCTYDIPYRCLIPKGMENLLIAGRPISSDSKAHGSIRVQPCCMATGQAAGTAAALAANGNLSPRDLDVVQLRTILTKQRAKLALL